MPITQEQLDKWARENAQRRGAQSERELYDINTAGLRYLQAAQEGRFAQARAPMETAVGVLGQQAQTLEGSQALLQAEQAREQAQARMAAMAAPGAILGGQIGQSAAQSYGGLEQEAAARQAAYLRGIGALGEGLTSEAEQRRATEQEILRDVQVRYAAAQKLQAAKREEAAKSKAAKSGGFWGAVGTLGGAIIGGLAGGPAGAATGAKVGGSLGGGGGG